MNQTPEQKARDRIDRTLKAAGWVVTDRCDLDWKLGPGIAVREYPTEIGPADYVLFAERQPLGVIEAKREEEGHRLSVHESQAQFYAQSGLKWMADCQPLPFVYESNGIVIRFTDMRDPQPRSRPVFAFHRPEELARLLGQSKTLRQRFFDLPELPADRLRACQVRAISRLERSFQENRPRALVQMATGSGKTYTAITFIYRLLKFVDARRILFLVDTKNLGEQAEAEFRRYIPADDNRIFTELYNVCRLNSAYAPPDSQVCISTIQRIYSILSGETLDEAAEKAHPQEFIQTGKPKTVTYTPDIPPEFFDFIVIDECHRSIYNLWKQVLEYFDAFLIGLTATPDKRTFGFFNENVVSEYSHEEAVADGVNVGHEVYTIETRITKAGAGLAAETWVDKRDRLTRRQRWEQLDEELTYSGRDLDKEVVNPSQIRKVIKTFREKLPEIFPHREEVPKTLIFAKTDSHADDIIQLVREEFAQGNDFCQKVTYNSEKDPKSILAAFRNDYNPRIAVTVDMIATGTDVKPLECLLFMRDVRSRNYFEQMKGRGTRILGKDELHQVTPSAHSNKTHFVIVDAVGVTKTHKTDSRPLERKKGVPLKDLLQSVLMGADDEDTFSSLADRLGRLEKQISPKERETFQELAEGKTINQVTHDLLDAHHPDRIEEAARREFDLPADETPDDSQKAQAQKGLIDQAKTTFTGPLNQFIENARKRHEQIIDTHNIDAVEFAGWDQRARTDARTVIKDFTDFIQAHKDEITALSVFYNQPYHRRELTFEMMKELLNTLKQNRPHLAPLHVWNAYQQLETVKDDSPRSELTALVALVRRVAGIDQTLTTFERTVNRNFQKWVFEKQAGPLKFNPEQMDWLHMIKDHIISSVRMDMDDFEYEPFDGKGGMGKMFRLFGEDAGNIVDEMNKELAA